MNTSAEGWQDQERTRLAAHQEQLRLMELVRPTLEKQVGKQITMRLETALKKAHPELTFRLLKSWSYWDLRISSQALPSDYALMINLSYMSQGSDLNLVKFDEHLGHVRKHVANQQVIVFALPGIQVLVDEIDSLERKKAALIKGINDMVPPHSYLVNHIYPEKRR